MPTNRRFSAWLLALVALLLFSTMSAAGSPPPKEDAPKADCAFSNAYYSGWCRVTVGMADGVTPQQACGAVLQCLNGDNSSCQGNINPCHAPDIRNGWRLEEAKVSQPQPTPRR
jgi:hypothetical protein